MGYALQGALSISVFFAFLAAAPFVMMTVMRRPAAEYGLMFVLISGAFMIGNFLAGRYSARVGADRMIILGSVGSLAGRPCCRLVLMLAGSWTPLATCSCPPASAPSRRAWRCPTRRRRSSASIPQAAGTASGLGGFLQMGLAAVVAQIVGSIQDGTPYPMAIGMSLCAAAALISALVAIHSRRRHSAA